MEIGESTLLSAPSLAFQKVELRHNKHTYRTRAAAIPCSQRKKMQESRNTENVSIWCQSLWRYCPWYRNSEFKSTRLFCDFPALGRKGAWSEGTTAFNTEMPLSLQSGPRRCLGGQTARMTYYGLWEALAEYRLLCSNQAWRAPCNLLSAPRKALVSRNGTLTVNEILCHRKWNTDTPLIERTRKEKKRTHSNCC